MSDDRRAFAMICFFLMPFASRALAEPPSGHNVISGRSAAELARRARKAAWLPNLRARFGFGSGALTALRDSSSGEYFTTTATDVWRFDVEAVWSLDRLVYHPAEARLLALQAQLELARLRREILVDPSEEDSAP